MNYYYVTTSINKYKYELRTDSVALHCSSLSSVQIIEKQVFYDGLEKGFIFVNFVFVSKKFISLPVKMKLFSYRERKGLLLIVLNYFLCAVVTKYERVLNFLCVYILPSSRTWEENIKIDLKKIWWECCRLEFCGSGW
jgi:hypothetical protein